MTCRVDGRMAARPPVDGAVWPLRIAAIEVDAEPLADARAIRRDVEAGAGGARLTRLFIDIDRGKRARFPHAQRGAKPAHASADDNGSHISLHARPRRPNRKVSVSSAHSSPSFEKRSELCIKRHTLAQFLPELAGVDIAGSEYGSPAS